MRRVLFVVWYTRWISLRVEWEVVVLDLFFCGKAFLAWGCCFMEVFSVGIVDLR